jgi:hypothetical protein
MHQCTLWPLCVIVMVKPSCTLFSLAHSRTTPTHGATAKDRNPQIAFMCAHYLMWRIAWCRVEHFSMKPKNWTKLWKTEPNLRCSVLVFVNFSVWCRLRFFSRTEPNYRKTKPNLVLGWSTMNIDVMLCLNSITMSCYELWCTYVGQLGVEV